ncbi:protoporphyrinogen oxidase HemJ [Rubellimicrobium sp. CFH 75288]|uniref:protoporphyrinogen oxidase HemJ n=1 Tax=Rubellimicrobium sp. CFH 75288 TaxID=2697034 RepID=UPI0014121010|nr:protoporphyrinogen oxidase HemJ [Rubellimicrobium sp. CFH 75288]NAZ37771.1 protoporphyrinogen oxidase HemJ [Rubellimicrobium sp. CFH 75288]
MPDAVQEALAPFYLWLKAAHVIAMVAWMAGLFYLPRLFVYHAEQAPAGSALDATFRVMERRLLRAIMNPAMVATWLLGLLLASLGGWWTAGWFHLKLAAVLGLTAFHGWCAFRRRDFAAGRNTRSGRTFRLMNEVPTLLLVVIVAAVVVKPF